MIGHVTYERGERADALAEWLAGDGLKALDGIGGEALDVIGVVDRELTIRYVNWTAAGLTREGVVGKSALDLVPPDDREIARSHYAKVLETGSGTRFETMYRDDANILFWDVRVGPIRSDGEIIGLIVITSDVTEQRRANADRDRFFSLSLDMLAVVSPNGHFKRVNPAFGDTLGYTISDLIARPFIEFVHPEDRPRTLEAFAQLLGGTPVTDFENRYQRRDGVSRVFSWRATVDPVTGDVYAVARDISDQRLTEAQLRHAQKLEAVGQLAGGVAHDFNNILLAILANTELALEGGPGARDLGEYLHEIQGAAQRAADLTKQLLAFSRRQPLRPVPVDLNQLIRRLMQMLRRLLPESIAIAFVPGPSLASVSADPSQLEQVIVNLCVNARDAMERGGQLTIATENVQIDGRYRATHPWAKPGPYVLLRVTDTGVGMTAEVRERAFEPFFTTKGTHQGTGLGLSTVYGIVRQHEGMIQLSSERGVGTTFEMYLPADTRQIADAGPIAVADDEIEAPPPGGQETILLAEDEEQVRRAVVQILQHAGYRTLAAVNGLDALRLLHEYPEPVHLVLLDLVMPVLGGPETWAQMRGLRPGLRVLFTSGYADHRYRNQLPPHADVIEKPFRADELLRRIRKELDEQG